MTVRDSYDVLERHLGTVVFDRSVESPAGADVNGDESVRTRRRRRRRTDREFAKDFVTRTDLEHI